VADLADVVGQAERLGYRIAVPLKRPSPTIAMAMIEDPDGNWIELLQHD
jgi:hypothetical protein